jgi:ABC-type sugar transport system substrate-binding protein
LLHKLPNFLEYITSNNDDSGSGIYAALRIIVKANGTRVNVVIFSGYNWNIKKESGYGN